ncbi:zinc ribbon domain-containing protein [Clostridium bowmanii]|nr:zinc ribbon domain-containing protein [Clostridium bowmanii]
MKDTASTIGSKSLDMVETGKLKLQRTQLETTIKEKKLEIGDLIYTAQKQTIMVDSDILKNIFEIINGLEKQITDIDEKLHKEVVLTTSTPAFHEDVQDESIPSQIYCSKCGQELSKGAKFCIRCCESQ